MIAAVELRVPTYDLGRAVDLLVSGHPPIPVNDLGVDGHPPASGPEAALTTTLRAPGPPELADEQREQLAEYLRERGVSVLADRTLVVLGA
jgi:hypothetical protein